MKRYRDIIDRRVKGRSGRSWLLRRFYPNVISLLGSREQPIIDFEEPPTGIVGAPTYLMRGFILPTEGAFDDAMSDFNVIVKRASPPRPRRR